MSRNKEQNRIYMRAYMRAKRGKHSPSVPSGEFEGGVHRNVNPTLLIEKLTPKLPTLPVAPFVNLGGKKMLNYMQYLNDGGYTIDTSPHPRDGKVVYRLKRIGAVLDPIVDVNPPVELDPDMGIYKWVNVETGEVVQADTRTSRPRPWLLVNRETGEILNKECFKPALAGVREVHGLYR